MKKTALAALLALALPAAAHTIYPIDRATMMAGGLFDVKIEFDQEVAQEDVQVLINGQPLGEELGGTREFVAQETANPFPRSGSAAPRWAKPGITASRRPPAAKPLPCNGRYMKPHPSAKPKT